MKLIKEEFLSRSRSDFPLKIISLEIESFSIVYQMCIRCNKFTAFKLIYLIRFVTSYSEVLTNVVRMKKWS